MEKDKGILIAILGKARSGKDTFTKFLADELFNLTKRRFIITAYAKELKDRLQKDFDLSYDQLWGDKKEVMDKRYPKPKEHFEKALYTGAKEVKWYWTPREMMQFYGTECMRAMDDNFWIKATFRTIEDKEYNNVIITDARFPNECKAVKDRNGYVIKIERSKDKRQEIHNASHASETSIDSYNDADFIVDNNKDLTSLKESAKQVANFILSGEKLNLSLGELKNG